MYECPNCAGNLKFDIARQQMHCEYCGTLADPYSVNREKDAEEKEVLSGEYEVTVFTCPQCGGEIVSEDTTTKEDCRAAYGRMLRRAVFAPKELKDEALVERFRGIYMPYWVYSFEKKEAVTFPGKKTRRRGDYLITDHYMMDCRVEEAYKGLAYDASSTFSDSLSSAIAPFDMRMGKKFVPAFLSGFYADTSDVGKYVYLQEAEDLVVQDACRQLSRDWLCRSHHVEEGGLQNAFRNALRPSDRAAELAMLPGFFFGIADRMTGSGSMGNRRALQLVVGMLLFTGISLVFSFLNRHGGRASVNKPFLGGHFKEKCPVLAKPLCGIVSAAVILAMNPVSDWYYYTGAIVCMGTVLWAILDIIRQHSKLTTRKLPQLNRRGGDEVG